MAGVRVDPASAGPQIAATLNAAAAALSAPALIPPPAPAGTDPVSVAAANHVAVNSGRLSSQLAGGIPRLAAGAKAVTAALQAYVTNDAQGAAMVFGKGGGAAAAAAAIAGLDIPTPPSVTIPDLPIDMPAALAATVGEPDVLDAALRSGAGQTGLEAHALAWDGAASNLTAAAQSLHSLAGQLPATWEGKDSTALTSRLQGFARWMDESASAATSHAASARQVGAHWNTALGSHPRAENYEQTRSQYLGAMSRGDAGEASQREGELIDMKTASTKAINTYGEEAGGTNMKSKQPGDSPRVSGDGDPHVPNKPAEDYGAIDTDDLLSGDAADDAGEATGKAAGNSMESAMQIPSQIANSLGQSLGKAGQQLQQVGQQASQAASQLGSGMGGSPSSGMGSGMPRNPLSKLGSGGSGLSGLGGGGGGGRTLPASLPEQLSAPPAAAASTSSTATPMAGASGSAGRSGMGGGMMPMGMMPRGSSGGEGKEIDRNEEWFPDEALVKDEAETTEPIAGQRKRVRPTET